MTGPDQRSALVEVGIDLPPLTRLKWRQVSPGVVATSQSGFYSVRITSFGALFM